MRGALARAGIAAWLALGVAAAAPAEPPSEPGWLDRPYLTGDWSGHRTRLAERGIVPGARYTTGFWSNLDGGRDTGTRYEGFGEWWLDVDLETLVGWKGAGFHIDWYSYHGGKPSEALVGLFATQTVSGWEAEDSVRFYEIFLRQEWGDGRFLLEVGQLAADTDFFLSENAADLLNGTFGFLGLGRDTSPFYPTAAPGVYLRARTADERWELGAGVYVGDPGEDTRGNYGFDWSFEDGADFLGELRAYRSPFGLPGSYAVGFLGTTGEEEDLGTGRSEEGNIGPYALIDQLLLEKTPTRPGLGVFLRSYGAPWHSRSLVSWYVDAGFRLTRPFPGRDEDVFSVGVAYLRLTDEFVDSRRAEGEDVKRSQAVLELTYRFQAAGWLTLQPNLQLVFDPTFGREDATVIGLRGVIEL